MLVCLFTKVCNNIYIMLNYNRKQEKIALYRYKDVCNKNPRLQFNVTTQYAYDNRTATNGKSIDKRLTTPQTIISKLPACPR